MLNELRERLSGEEVKWLACSLLECVEEMSDWNNLVNDLPADIRRNFIQRDVTLNQYIENLIRASIKYRGGVEKLMGLVRLTFGRTIAWESLATPAFQLLTNNRLSEEFAKELIEIIDRPEPRDFYRAIQRIYDQSSGDVVSGYAPSGAYDALLMLFQLPSPGAGINFVSLLAQEEIEQERKDALLRWVEKAGAFFPSETRAVSRAESSSNYLMIQLDQVRAGADEFILESWLLRHGRFTLLDLKLLDLNDQPQKLVAIAETIQRLVSLLRGTISDFTLEMIVPRHLFCHDVSQWRVTIGNIESDLPRQLPLAFRCIDRFKARRRGMKEGQSLIQLMLAAQAGRVNLPNWRKKSAALRNADQSSVEEAIFCITSDDQFDQTQLYEKLEPDDKGVCVGFGFALAGSTGAADALSTVIDACGAPVIVYFRELPEDSRLDEQTIKDLFCESSQAAPAKTKLVELPTHVWKIRKEAVDRRKKDDIRYHITLMFDDYDRVPEPGPHRVPQEEIE